MAKTDTFKVSSRNHEGFEITHSRVPETIEEFVSLNLVQKEQDVIDLAHQALVIKMQAGARSRLDQGEDAVQEYVDNYTYGARTGGGGSRKPKISASQATELGFSEEQLAALAAAGVKIEQDEEE